MTDASYSILKYVADPMRNEPINVGIIIWARDVYEMYVDDEALGRVLAFNPTLDRSLLENFREYVQWQLNQAVSGVDRRLVDELPYPLVVSPTIDTTLDAEAVSEEHLHSLLMDEATYLGADLVKLRYRTSGTRRKSSQFEVRQRLQPFIDNKRVQEHFTVLGKRTGAIRELSFYAHEHAKVALEIVRIPPGKFGEESVTRTSDAVAYEIEDVKESDDVTNLITYLPMDRREEVRSLLPSLDVRLRGLNVPIYTDLHSVVREFKSLAGLNELAAD